MDRVKKSYPETCYERQWNIPLQNHVLDLLLFTIKIPDLENEATCLWYKPLTQCQLE